MVVSYDDSSGLTSGRLMSEGCGLVLQPFVSSCEQTPKSFLMSTLVISLVIWILAIPTSTRWIDLSSFSLDPSNELIQAVLLCLFVLLMYFLDRYDLLGLKRRLDKYEEDEGI